jgi:predicted RNA-binding protein with PIN domain
VTVKFARPGKTADEEIKVHLVRLGKRAREWTVVSSDASIQTAARAARARPMSSDTFSLEIEVFLSKDSFTHKPSSDVEMTPDELEKWLKDFGEDPSDR